MNSGRDIPVQRHEHGDGYTIRRFARLPGIGMLRGEDVYQYISGDGLYAVGAQHTLRTAWLNGELVTDPAKARALWQEAGWLDKPEPETAGYRCWSSPGGPGQNGVIHHTHGPGQPCPLSGGQ